VELIYFSSTLYKVPQYGWLPLVFVACFITLMGTWYYGRKEAYQYEVNHKLSLDWLNNLGPKLDTRIPGVGLIYTELNQGVPAIFQHLIENSATHSTLVFVTVKRLPVPHVSQEERILLRRVGPPAHSMYKCAVRYGYKDPQDGAEFEELLMAAIIEFIRAEALGNLRANNNNNATNGLHVDDSVPLSGEIDRNPSFVTGGAALDRVAAKMVDDSVHDAVNHLNSSRRHGIVYILGHTELRASHDSNFFRKFIINVLYNFIRRNFRSSLHTLNIPHTRLLQVGMVHYI
jgi:KUP system potassium uptake protein